MTAAPTDDPAEIASASATCRWTPRASRPRSRPSPRSSASGAIQDARGNAYRTMVIVVTDEVGDDEDHLEEAIEVAVDGQGAGLRAGLAGDLRPDRGADELYRPQDRQPLYNLPVRQGPESVMPEQVRLPFWYGGDQYDLFDSGFGPYALSRLAGATGGIYFVTRLGQSRMGFDPVAMREYRPDWVSRARYESDVRKHPVRRR